MTGDDPEITEEEAVEGVQYALRKLAEDEEGNDDADDFKCPRCGSRSVRCHGNGERDCMECPYRFRPNKDTSKTTQQSGLTDY